MPPPAQLFRDQLRLGTIDKATEALQRCAATTMFSALVDVYVFGAGFDLSDVASHRMLLMILRTIWKGFLSYTLLQVSILRNKNVPPSESVPTNLTMMTQVWQVVSVMVTLSATSNFAAAMKHLLAGVGGGLFVIVLGIYVLCSIVSKKDTREIVPNKSYSGHLPSTLDNIRQKGVMLAKFMLLATAGLMLQTLLLPIVAMVRIRHIHETFVVLLNIPAPLAMGGYLYTLRGRMIKILVQMCAKQEATMELPPETVRQLDTVQLKFYDELTAAFKADMTLKGAYSFIKLFF